MSQKKVLVIFLLLGLVLSGCNKPFRAAVSPLSAPPSVPSQTWIDAPLDNTNLPLEPYTIVFHATSLDTVNEFEIWINGVFSASVRAALSGEGGSISGTLFYGEYLWTPPAPGSYLLLVRAKAGEQPGSFDEVMITVGEEITEAEDSLEVTSTPTSTPTSTYTLTPAAETEPCTITALVNLFCRPGPGYEPNDSFTPGQTAPIIAQSQFLWKVIGANNGVECTVPKDDQFVSLSGSCENVPEFNPPPPPTPTYTSTPKPTAIPTDTPTPQPAQGCTVRQVGGGIICVSPCPAGAAPGNTCTP